MYRTSQQASSSRLLRAHNRVLPHRCAAVPHSIHAKVNLLAHAMPVILDSLVSTTGTHGAALRSRTHSLSLRSIVDIRTLGVGGVVGQRYIWAASVAAVPVMVVSTDQPQVRISEKSHVYHSPVPAHVILVKQGFALPF